MKHVDSVQTHSFCQCSYSRKPRPAKARQFLRHRHWTGLLERCGRKVASTEKCTFTVLVVVKDKKMTQWNYGPIIWQNLFWKHRALMWLWYWRYPGHQVPLGELLAACAPTVETIRGSHFKSLSPMDRQGAGASQDKHFGPFEESEVNVF